VSGYDFVGDTRRVNTHEAHLTSRSCFIEAEYPFNLEDLQSA